MPARRPAAFAAPPPVLVPTRLPRVVTDYLDLVVRLRHPGFVFANLTSLQQDIVKRFLTLAPYPAGFDWLTPRVPSNEPSPAAFRQVNFQLPANLAERVKRTSDKAGVTRAAFLYTATIWHIGHVATPAALDLET